jgi:hypothetical protein
VIPSTANGRALATGLLLLTVGLGVALPPVALWGPGLGSAVLGAILVLLAFITPPEERT